MAGRKNQPKLIYENPVLFEVSKFLDPLSVLNLSDAAIREVDEKTEAIPKDMLMYANCEDLNRLVKIPDLERLFLYTEGKSDCNMENLYNLRGLTELYIKHTGYVDVSRLVNMRHLRFLDIREGIIISPFKPMNLDTLMIEYTEPDSNIPQSINNLQLLTKLRLARPKSNDNLITNMSFLNGLDNLVHLELENMGDLINTKYIGWLTQLETLNLRGSNLSSHSFVKKLKNLTLLSIDGNIESSIDWLYNMRKITNLSLANFAIDDEALNRIAELPLLERLSLTRASITRFTEMPNLEFLHLSNCDNLTDYSELLNCNNLVKVVIEGNNIPENILFYLRRLKIIELYPNEMSFYDYSPLINNQVVELLHVNGAIITDEDMQIISTISNLEILGIVTGHGESFGDVEMSHLLRLTKLEILNISYNDLITDEGVEQLSQLPNLKELDISHCDNITAEIFYILATFPKLTKVTLPTFNEEDTQPLRVAKPNIVIIMIDRLREFVPEVQEAMIDAPPEVVYDYNSDDGEDNTPIPEEFYPYATAEQPQQIPSEEKDYTQRGHSIGYIKYLDDQMTPSLNPGSNEEKTPPDEEVPLPRWIFEKK